MKIINNITDKLSDELKEKLEPGSKLSIAAACFSVYAFEELKTQLEGIDALRFIFTSPTFLAEQPEKAQREFYIPRLNREKTLYGSEFEIRLRNEFTQKAISRECAEWVRRKASFKSNVTSELMPGFMTVENAAPCAFAPVNGFTRADLGCERGGNMFSMINEIDAPESAAYINLKARVETRMKALVMTSTGDDNLLSPEEQGDLEYRRRQLQRLQTEVVDLEEMGTGVSITDLGLNEFRMELMEYAKHHPELETSPGGISAVAKATPDAPAGVVFVLKNVHNEVNIDSRNRLHPYYLVYLSEDGVTIHDHLSPKDTLDAMRQLCRGKDKPIEGLYQAFNAETDDGRSMEVYSSLLEDAVLSIVDAKEDSDLDSLFKSGGTSALLSQVSGLDDFQLVCFLVVREEER